MHWKVFACRTLRREKSARNVHLHRHPPKVADILLVSTDTVMRESYRRRLQAFRVDRFWRVLASVLERYIEREYEHA